MGRGGEESDCQAEDTPLVKRDYDSQLHTSRSVDRRRCCSLYGFWTAFHSLVLWVYFRRIVLEGQDNVPTSGPVILAANHNNAAVDGVVLFVKTVRAIRFIAKETLIKMACFGCCISSIGTIPVTCTLANQPLTLAPLQVTRPQDSKPAGDGETLSEKGYKSRIGDMFASVVDALHADSCVCIFPEGYSHNLASLAQDKHTGGLKWGIGEMTLQACAAGAPVRVVPVGLNYDNKSRLRSSVFLSYGKPIDIAAADVAAYSKWKAEHPEEHPRDNPHVLKLLSEIQAGIESVLIAAPNHETLFKAQLAYRVWSGNYDMSLDATIPVLGNGSDEALAGYYNHIRHFIAMQVSGTGAAALDASTVLEIDDDDQITLDGSVGQTVRLLDHYYSTLAVLGVEHSDVMDDRISPYMMAFQLFLWSLLMLVLIPIIIPGILMLAPIYWFSRCVALTASKSTAKAEVSKGLQPEGYTGEDSIATIMIMSGMFASLLFTLIYASVGSVVLDGVAGINFAGWFFITLAAVLALMGAALLFMDQERAVRNVWVHTMQKGFRCGPERFANLKHMQAVLKHALSDHALEVDESPESSRRAMDGARESSSGCGACALNYQHESPESSRQASDAGDQC